MYKYETPEVLVGKKFEDLITLEQWNKFIAKEYPIEQKEFERIKEYSNPERGYVEIHEYKGRPFLIVQVFQTVLIFDDETKELIGAQDIYEGEGYAIINRGRILFQSGHDSCGFFYFDELYSEKSYIR